MRCPAMADPGRSDPDAAHGTDACIVQAGFSNTDLQSGQITAAAGTRTEVFAANDVRILIANNPRSLICRCPATQQPVNLQIFADYATLNRIGSNSVRFRC